MIQLTLKRQLLLAPVVILILITGLFGFLLPRLADIHEQNEVVRDWIRSVGHADAALAAGRRLETIVRQLATGRYREQDDPQFAYLEQSVLFSDHLRHPALLARLKPETHAFLRDHEAAIRYREHMDIAQSQGALASILPRLEQLRSALWAQKRAAYVAYYENVNSRAPRLIMVSVVVFILCVLSGIALTLWALRSITGRLHRLADGARAICDGRLSALPTPTHNRDEVDALHQCLATMTDRLINVVSSEKMLQGAEDERRRIAMDLHDQTLSDLTNARRDLQTLRAQLPAAEQPTGARLAELEQALEETADNVRAIMDDLHPQTLDILGLEAALRAYIEKHLKRPGLPVCHLRIDADADRQLTDMQRLMLYRITLEAVRNAVRHAACTRYEIGLRHVNDTLILTVEDNGTGLDGEKRRPGENRGLVNMEQRARAIGARLRWMHSRFSSGMGLELRLPLSPGHVQAAEPATAGQIRHG